MEQTPNDAAPQDATAPGVVGPDATPGVTEDAEQPKRGFRAWLAHAFAVDPYDESSLSEEERAALERVAHSVHVRGMTAAAITWVESHRNFNWMGSQALVFANPLYDLGRSYLNAFLKVVGLGSKVSLSLSSEELSVLASALEKRYSIEYFVQRLEALDAEAETKRRAELFEPKQP